ncbi:MAG: hypothetical protein ACTSRZ_08040 [Promethearchaeota archaeon]
MPEEKKQKPKFLGENYFSPNIHDLFKLQEESFKDFYKEISVNGNLFSKSIEKSFETIKIIENEMENWLSLNLSEEKIIESEEIVRKINNYRDFFEFFIEENYLIKPNMKKKINKDILLYQCIFKNPLTKTEVFREEIIVINLNSKELSIDLPELFISEYLKYQTETKMCFVDFSQRKILKTSPKFLILLYLNGDDIDDISKNEIRALLKQIEGFRNGFSEELNLVFKLDHNKIFRKFWFIEETSIHDFQILEEIFEEWEYNLKWNQIRIKRNYKAREILSLIKEWRRKERLKSKRKGKEIDSSYYDIIFADQEDNVLSIDEDIVDYNILSDDIFVSLDGKIDDLINKADVENQVNMELLDIEDIIEDDMEINILEPPILFDIDRVAEIRKCVAQFLKFQEDTDDLRLKILDINNNIYELYYEDNYDTGEILLIDINNTKSLNDFLVGGNTIRNLFDIINQTESYRIFFCDIDNQTIMEVTRDFIYNYLYEFDLEQNIDKIDELNDINRQAELLKESIYLPFIVLLKLHLSSIDLVINFTEYYNFSEDILSEIIGIWEYDKEIDQYKQIYPEREEETEEQTGEQSKEQLKEKIA